MTYELFNAKSAFSRMGRPTGSHEQQKRWLIANLTPSLAPIPEEYSQILLCLIVYWHAHITGSEWAQFTLADWLEEERRKGSM